MKLIFRLRRKPSPFTNLVVVVSSGCRYKRCSSSLNELQSSLEAIPAVWSPAYIQMTSYHQEHNKPRIATMDRMQSSIVKNYSFFAWSHGFVIEINRGNWISTSDGDVDFELLLDTARELETVSIDETLSVASDSVFTEDDQQITAAADRIQRKHENLIGRAVMDGLVATSWSSTNGLNRGRSNNIHRSLLDAIYTLHTDADVVLIVIFHDDTGSAYTVEAKYIHYDFYKNSIWISLHDADPGARNWVTCDMDIIVERIKRSDLERYGSVIIQ